MIMEKQCVVLLTGAGGDAQGWGNMQVTEAVKDAIIANGYDCRIITAENREEMEKGLNDGKCSIVWSALYFFSSREAVSVLGSRGDFFSASQSERFMSQARLKEAIF